MSWIRLPWFVSELWPEIEFRVRLRDDDEMMKLPILPCAEKRASFVYRTKNVDNNDKDSKNRKQSH